MKTLLLFISLLFYLNDTNAQTGDSKREIEFVLSSYVQAFYDADTTAISRVIHPDVRKRGFDFVSQAASTLHYTEMDFKKIIEHATNWNSNRKKASKDHLRKIEIFDIQDKTASAKVSAQWGIDYFHLAKENGSWYIFNILWQGHPAQAHIKEQQLVGAAIMDYVEGLYEVDTLRIYRSVHPELVKRGFGYNASKKDYGARAEMDFNQLVSLTSQWNAGGKRADQNSPKNIKIYDVQDKTASAKLTAVWGTDYFHLIKINERWWIMNVIWQSIPQK
jgi:hypothetical protein